MTKEQLTFNLKIVSDISDARSNVEQLQKIISNLGANVKPDLGVKFSNKFNAFFKEYDRFTKLQDTPNKSKSQLNTMEQSGNRLVEILKQLGDLTKKINWGDIGISEDLKTIKEYANEITRIKEEMAGFLQADTGLSASFQELQKSLGSGALATQFSEAVNTSDIEQIIPVLDKIDRYFKKNDTVAAWSKKVREALSAFSRTEEITKRTEELAKAQDRLFNATNLGDAEEIGKQIVETWTKMSNAVPSVTNKIVEMNAAEAESARQMEQVKTRMLQFISAANGIQLVRRAFQQTFSAVKELDDVMTDMAVVTNLNVGDYWEQLPKYTDRAYELGASIKSVYESMTLYYQQGLNTAQATALSTSTMKMAKIASLGAEEATQRMTNALRGFNMALNEASAINIADVYSALAAKSAANVDQISTAMTKVASIAHSANMEFETTAALLTQIIETTQESAETAGTALKTVIARFSEVKKLITEGLNAGTDEEGGIIDVNNISAALRAVGINLNEYITGSVGLDKIFLELASKWNTLDTVTQKYIATQAAGSRQQSRFIAMMQDYARTTELVSIANNSNGASAEQFAKTLDSLESKLQQFKTQWQSFTTTIFNQGIIKGFVSTGTELLKFVNNLTKATGSFSFLTNIGVSFVAWKGLKAIITGVSKSLTNYTAKVKLTQEAQQTLAKSKMGVGVGAKELREAEIILKSELSLKQKTVLLDKAQANYSELIAKWSSARLNEEERNAAVLQLENQVYKEETANLEVRDILNNQLLTNREKAVALASMETMIANGVTKEEAEQLALIQAQKTVGVTKNIVDQFSLVLQKKANREDAKNLLLEKAKTVEGKKQLAYKIAASMLDKPWAWAIGAAAAIGAITAGIIAFNNTSKQLHKHWEKTNEQLEETKQNLVSANEEIKTIEDRINELQRKGPLTLVEQSELEQLKKDLIFARTEQEQAQRNLEKQQAKTDKAALKALDSRDYVEQKRSIQGLDTTIKVDKDDLLSAWQEFNSLSEKKQQEWAKDNQDFFRESAKQNIISYTEALSFLDPAKELLGSSATLEELLVDKYGDATWFEDQGKKLAELLGANIDWIKEYADALYDVTNAYSKLGKQGKATWNKLIKDISTGAVELTKANIYNVLSTNYSDLGAEFLSSVERYPEKALLFIQSNREIGGSLSSLITEFNNCDEKIRKIESAFEDLQKTGTLSISDLNTIIEEFGEYLTDDMVQSLSKGGKEAEDTIKSVIGTYLTEQNLLDGLTESRKELYIQQLKNLGVINAEEVVKLKLTAATRRLTESELERLRVLGASSEAILKYIAALDALQRLESGAMPAVEMEGYDANQDPEKIRQILEKQRDAIFDTLFDFDPFQLLKGSEEAWKNSFDKYYNNLERIAELTTHLSDLQEDYNNLLLEGNSSKILANQKAQLSNLQAQANEYEILKQAREKEMKDLLKANSKYKKYATYVDGQISINWSEINKVKDSDTGKAIESYVSELERIDNSIDEVNSNLIKNTKDQYELAKQNREAYISLESKIKEALITEREKQIDALEELGNKIDEVNSSIVDNINSVINEQRNQRERDKDAKELENKRIRLEYLRQDTSGANLLAIKQLEEEIKNAEQDYTDQLIDDKINELEKQNDDAAEQRKEQIALMRDQLESYQNTEAFWGEIINLMEGSTTTTGQVIDDSSLISLLQTSEDYQSMSPAEREQWLEEMRKLISGGIAGKQFMRYGTGGLADYTGIAWLDGTPTQPEIVLNSQDSENFMQLKDVLSRTMSQAQAGNSFGNTYYQFEINVEQLANDYDVDQMMAQIQNRIEQSAQYRNVNAINLIR